MKRCDQGFIMVQALVIIAVGVALLAVIAASQRTAMDSLQTTLDQRRAAQAANAAVAEAMAQLSQVNTSQVTLNDTWATLGTDSSTQSALGIQTADQEYDMGDGSSFRVQLIDAGSLLNINLPSTSPTTAQRAQWQTELLDLGLTQQQVDCLYDWETPGETAQPDGAKDSFYNAQPQPYNAELGPLNTVDELLLVDNWTAQTLYQPITASSGGGSTSTSQPTDSQGNILPLASIITVDSESPNTQASGSARITPTQALANAGITLRRGQTAPTTFAQVLTTAPAIANNANAVQQLLNTMSDSGTNTVAKGKINLNTASQAVLQTVLQASGMSTGIASAIQSQQASGFTSLGQLATIPGITPSQALQIADNFTIGSDTWIVRAWGQDNGAGVAVEAVIRVTNDQPQVINWNRINTTSLPEWWDWQAQSTSTVQAGEIQ